jgi:iron(III) transport system permease protein
MPVDMSELLSNTLSVSGLAAVVVALAAFPLALLANRAASRWGRWLVGLSYTGNVLPGIVVALALVFFAANYLPAWYQTIPLLVVGYATRFLPLSLGATRSALAQINPRLEEAGRCLGLHPWQVALRVTVPLARSGIVAGAALVFLSAMKELPTTLILSPIGMRTFATRIWSVYEEAMLVLIGGPGLLLIAASALSLLIILRQDQPLGNWQQLWQSTRRSAVRGLAIVLQYLR